MDCNICNNPIKNKMMKFSAIFFALSFAATMFSYPGLMGTANAQSDQGSESACGPGFTLQQGKCISETPPTLKCPDEFPILINGKCFKQVDKVPFCPEGDLVKTDQGLKCKIVKGVPEKKCEPVAGQQGTLVQGVGCVATLKNTEANKAACLATGPFAVWQPIDKYTAKCIYAPVLKCADPLAKIIDGKCVVFKDPLFKCPDGSKEIAGKCLVQGPNPTLTCEEQPGTQLVNGQCVKKPGSNQGTLIPPPTGEP